MRISLRENRRNRYKRGAEISPFFKTYKAMKKTVIIILSVAAVALMVWHWGIVGLFLSSLLLLVAIPLSERED